MARERDLKTILDHLNPSPPLWEGVPFCELLPVSAAIQVLQEKLPFVWLVEPLVDSVMTGLADNKAGWRSEVEWLRVVL
jgi:hypothetical protein